MKKIKKPLQKKIPRKASRNAEATAGRMRNISSPERTLTGGVKEIQSLVPLHIIEGLQNAKLKIRKNKKTLVYHFQRTLSKKEPKTSSRTVVHTQSSAGNKLKSTLGKDSRGGRKRTGTALPTPVKQG